RHGKGGGGRPRCLRLAHAGRLLASAPARAACFPWHFPRGCGQAARELMAERTLTPEQRQRYARHLALAEVGPAGQQKLLRARVLIVGVGALGHPVALYLAASGVGTIGLADHDHVRLSNLQRQIIHTMEGLNRSKVDGAARMVSALNPEIKVETVEATVDERNAMELLDRYEVIVDGLVNRVLLHDTMAMTFREVRYRRNRACPVCGDHPTVQTLVDYDAFVLEART